MKRTRSPIQFPTMRISFFCVALLIGCSDGASDPVAPTAKAPASAQTPTTAPAPSSPASTVTEQGASAPAIANKRVGHREESPKDPKLGDLVNVREFYENGQLYTERTERVAGERQRVRVGAMRAWWENGKPRLEGSYDEQGRLDGRWRYFFENGTLEREGDYSESKHTGDWVENWPNGKRRYEGFYHVGLREGVWRTWHENGAPESEGEYQNNLREGPWKFWLPDGGDDRAQSGLYAGNVRLR